MDIKTDDRCEKMWQIRDELLAVEEDRLQDRNGCTLATYRKVKPQFPAVDLAGKAPARPSPPRRAFWMVSPSAAQKGPLTFFSVFLFFCISMKNLSHAFSGLSQFALCKIFPLVHNVCGRIGENCGSPQNSAV